MPSILRGSCECRTVEANMLKEVDRIAGIVSNHKEHRPRDARGWLSLSQGKRRYHHPAVTANDISEQKGRLTTPESTADARARSCVAAILISARTRSACSTGCEMR